MTASRFPHPLTLLVACILLAALPVLGALVGLAAAAIGLAVVGGL